MTPSAQDHEEKLLAALALALIEHPNANLQQLARAIGISKATLYRFCATRELLIERLMQRAVTALGQAIHSAELDGPAPKESLRRLAANCLENQALMLFLMYFWRPGSSIEQQMETQWLTTLDAFFLRGQQAGVFRIDISAAAMTEFWIATLVGLQDAERRGRVARQGLAGLLETAFLQGAAC